MLEAVCLHLLVDPSLELSVNPSGFSFLLIVKLILDHSAQMMQETDCSKRCRPIAVGPDAVQKLLGIGIPMLCSRGQVGNGFLIIPLDLFAVEIDFSELVFRMIAISTASLNIILFCRLSLSATMLFSVEITTLGRYSLAFCVERYPA